VVRRFTGLDFDKNLALRRSNINYIIVTPTLIFSDPNIPTPNICGWV
jgi:hypothetical protein